MIDKKQQNSSLKTKDEYFHRLSRMSRNLYHNGEKIDRLDELQQATLQVMGITFDAALDPETADLCTATSHLTGDKINRFCHIHQNTNDLHKKQDMTRLLCRKAGLCIQRCMGVDAINAINATSFEADKMNGGNTEYHQNYLKWLKKFQDNDLVGACAQTDTKGERLKRPGKQTDPDAYLRVVEKKSDGIVVRGCKNHISEASIADEIIVVPTRAIMPDEKEYAVSFAIPADWDGLKQVVTIHDFRHRQHIPRKLNSGYTDSYLIFDDVYVPWDRVFLCGENYHGSLCALLFALFHRHSYSGCKPAIGDIILGLAALAAEHNGIENKPHVKKHLSEIIKVSELGYAAGFTAAETGKPELYVPGFGQIPYGPGSYIPNSIYANVGRCLTGESVFHEKEILCDIAGGIPSTLPYENDLVHPELQTLLEKYLNRNPNIPIRDQIKFWLFFSEYTCSDISAIMDYGNYHGGGSPVMEQIAIVSQYDIELRKNLIKDLAGIQY